MIVPTYNEKDNLDELVERITNACSSRAVQAEIVVVDDNSPDGTGERAEDIAKTYRMKVVHRSGKLGLSSAVLAGITASSGEIVVVMDADLSHPPESIPEMIGKIEAREAEVVFGSRYVRGGSVEKWPFYRRIVSKGATLLARGLTKVKDPMSGFFAFRREVIQGVNLSPVGYKIGLEVLVKGKYSKVVEVPIRFANRRAGKSKLGATEYLRYIDHVTLLYEHRRFWLAKYLKFAFIGGIGALINLAVLWVSVEIFFVYYLWAAVLAFVIADANNYIWNRWWTFRSKGKIRFQYPQFLLVSIDGLMLDLILLWALVEKGLPAIGIGEDKASLYIVLAQIIAIFLVSLFNFGANSMWTFREDTSRPR